jgi:hypothetical protein
MSIAKFLVVCGGSGEYLLGKRQILGLRGELQIDVKKELDATRTRLKGAVVDQITTVNLAEKVGNVLTLFTKNEETANRLNWDETARKTADAIAHAWIKNSALGDGMAQSAAIGGLAVNAKTTHDYLVKQLQELLQPAQPGEDLEFWIVSSVAGGTGEGIHRAVAENIMEVCKSRGNQEVKIRFIRIGGGTYASCNKNRKLDPTVLALAADAIFATEMKEKFKEAAATISWFYLDFPDYGAGPEIKKARGSVIDLGCKAVMQDQLTDVIVKDEVNANIIICRVGYWGKEYNENNLLWASLDGLETKINQFMNPDDTALTDGKEPPFTLGDFEERCKNLTDSSFLETKIDEGWQLPGFYMPKKFDELAEYLTRCEKSLQDLLGVFSSNVFSSFYKLQKQGGQVINEIPFVSETTAKDPGTIPWFDKVRNAQSIKAWSMKMLGIRWINPPQKSRSPWVLESGLLNSLFKKHKECDKAFSLAMIKNSTVKANDLVKNLMGFASLLNQVRLIRDQLSNSLNLLTGSMADTVKLKEYALEIKKGLPQRIAEGGAPIVVADLDEVLDQLNNATWFQLMYEMVTKKSPDVFKVEAARGGNGLTETGLKEVLQLKSTDNIQSILDELKNHVGKMMLVQENGQPIIVEGQWFGGHDPASAKLGGFNYRMLPKLSFPLEESKISNIKLIKTPFGMLGLNVLAFEGVTVAFKTDEITSHVFLTEPYVNSLKDFIKDEEWNVPITRGDDCHRLEIACGTVIGEPLAEEVLLRAGLSEVEINKLREYLVIKKISGDATNKMQDKPVS